MTLHDDPGRVVSHWLHEYGAHRVPDHLDAVLRTTSTRRQRAAWSSLERWLPLDISTRRVEVPSRVPVRTIAILAMLALLIAGLVVVIVGSRPLPVPAPFGPAHNGSMAYWANGDIYLANSDGTGGHAIVAGPTTDYQPFFSRDGTRLTFLRAAAAEQAVVMIAGADGGDVRAVTPEPWTRVDSVEWSPTGDRLAVVHVLGGKRVLSIIEVDGDHGISTIPSGDVEVDHAAYWLPPDGQELLFATRHVAGGTGSGIYSIRSDGTDLRLVTTGLAGDDDDFQDIALSPNGALIGYWNWEDRPLGTDGYTHVFDITTGRDRRDAFGRAAVVPRFSPDGKLIVAGTTRGGPLRVIVAPSDGSSPGRASGSPVATEKQFEIDFSPDGSKLLVGVQEEGAFIIDIASGHMQETGSNMPYVGGWQRLAP